MRGLLAVAAVVGLVGVASAERRKNPLPQLRCEDLAKKLGQHLGPEARTALTQRCVKDVWSSDAHQCFTAAGDVAIASKCLDTLTRTQRTLLAGDADRLADPRLGRWLTGRAPLLRAATNTPLVTLASYEQPADAAKPAKARTLQAQGMSAYKAGNYNGAVQKFSAAIDMQPSPELLYHAAQAYRLKGERAKALELYERYLELAPDGPAAPVCRWHVERLTDTP